MEGPDPLGKLEKLLLKLRGEEGKIEAILSFAARTTHVSCYVRFPMTQVDRGEAGLH